MYIYIYYIILYIYNPIYHWYFWGPFCRFLGAFFGCPFSPRPSSLEDVHEQKFGSSASELLFGFHGGCFTSMESSHTVPLGHRKRTYLVIQSDLFGMVK